MRWLTNLFLWLIAVPVGLAGRFADWGTKLRQRLLYWQQFRPRPGDVYIATYPKSGTTWMQMILVQLASGGRAEFDHILQASPYLDELMRFERVDHLERLPSPRLIKTHLSYEELRPPRDARIIFVTRDVKDTLVSCYHHAELAARFRSPFDLFMDAMLRGRGPFRDWFAYMRSWLPHRHDANVLWVRYEDLKSDLEGQVRRIAAFTGIPLEEARLGDILQRCGFQYMKQHDGKFDFRTGLYEASPGGFIRQGGSGGKNQLIRDEHAAELTQKVSLLRSELGLRNTEAL
ncbi:sulfotransferase domain-containing protein [Pyxidicoccus fallax]|uniref:Sulfotransferase domain-containing protein n=1 Tax=Pyxidicoccus fallax TaxID=394095 RepID=A0A848LIL9_9BACT|nr:sulfotransferase domain-containing protein [Pyxidicoccus fallax]NMO17563.1 sulfotransferase domain-containing protein [Pyxidicoccus fallax]NPC82911.1 sulfotransferase domain-containing protein [Pyxidicoccus fallax]